MLFYLQQFPFEFEMNAPDPGWPVSSSLTHYSRIKGALLSKSSPLKGLLVSATNETLRGLLLISSRSSRDQSGRRGLSENRTRNRTKIQISHCIRVSQIDSQWQISGFEITDCSTGSQSISRPAARTGFYRGFLIEVFDIL